MQAQPNQERSERQEAPCCQLLAAHCTSTPSRLRRSSCPTLLRNHHSATSTQTLAQSRTACSSTLPACILNFSLHTRAGHTSGVDGGSVAVSSSLRAQLTPLLHSLAACEPAPSDDQLLYFHTCIDAAIGHAHSFDAFSPTLVAHATSFSRLVALLASAITPSTPPASTFDSLLPPLRTTLSSPLSLALSTRHAALHTAALHATTAITPSHLTSFDYSVRLIASSSHIATLNQPTTLLTLHRTRRGASGDREAGDSSGSVSVELSAEQLDGLLSKCDEVARLLQTTVQ